MIPPVAHFIWIGREFPYLNFAAVASAAKRGGFSRVVLHHSDDLSHAPWWRALHASSTVECRRISPGKLVERICGAELARRYAFLSAPAALTNVLRVAILLEEGGVYLDLDTVTVKALTPLREASSFFCGSEHVAFPASLEGSKNPLRWAAALARTGLRDLTRRSANGVDWFHEIRSLYPLAANNAVLGAEPGHPFLRELCGRMLALTDQQYQRRYALGTSLLQHALRETACSRVTLHPPSYFYPLGPELSEHWFRFDSAARLEDVLTENTYVVHWYASVRTKSIAPQVDPAWVERHRDRQLLSALLVRALGTELLGAFPHEERAA